MGCHFCFAKLCCVGESGCFSILAPQRVAAVCPPRGPPPASCFLYLHPSHPLFMMILIPRSHEEKEKARATIVSSTNSLCPTLPCCHNASVSLPWGGGLKALLFLPSSVARIMMVLIIMFHDVCWASLLLEGGSIERQLPPSAQSHMPASTGWNNWNMSELLK